MMGRTGRIVLKIAVMLAAAGLFIFCTIQVRADSTAAVKPEYVSVPAHRDTYSTEFLYSDTMLLGDARELSTDLAKASMGLAVAAYDENGESAVQALSESYMDFDTVETVGYDRLVDVWDNDHVACVIATKTISGPDGDYLLYCLPIRGTAANSEWFSDFNLGTDGDHEGFYKAEKEVLDLLLVMTASDGYQDHPERRIIWTMGHSRGAAVANILAGELTAGTSKWYPGETLNIASEDHIFGYTYACPNVSKRADPSMKNIYNFNNPGDLIPAVPLESWGYRRYGRVVDEMNDRENIGRRFCEEFNNGAASSFESLQSNEDVIRLLSNVIITEEDYHKELPWILFNLLAFALGGSNDNDISDVLAYVGLDLSDWFVTELLSIPGAGLEELYNLAEDAGDCYDLLQSGSFQEALLMSDEEFQEWRSDHWEEINKIESMRHMNIDTAADLRAAVLAFSENNQAIMKLTQVLGTAMHLFFTEGFIPMEFISHGHEPATYGVWINSMYYGYKGWYDNQEVTDVTVPAGWNVGQYCFAYCGEIRELAIESRRSFLSQDSFYWCCGLEKLILPADYEFHQQTNIGETNLDIFEYTPGETGKLPDIYNAEEDEDLSEYRPENGIGKKTMILDKGITSIGAGFFRNTGELKSISLPSTLTEIGDYAFYWRDMDSIEIDPGARIEKIGKHCFEKNGTLTEEEVQRLIRDVTEIPEYCFDFAWFSPVTEITIPGTITKIGRNAFPSGDFFTIYGYRGTEAERFASENENRFVALDDPADDPVPSIWFSDVTDPDDFWYTPVYWAAGQGITTGWADGTFRPWNTCTRAAVVTFLWRIAGCPEPDTMADFPDLPADTEGNSDFRNAISWAAEQGITGGYTDGTFRPWKKCNRAAIITFLWRYAGRPEPVLFADFSDLPSDTPANYDFRHAISWGSERKIITGWSDGTFRPWNTCNRAATVTFLYRYSQK